MGPRNLIMRGNKIVGIVDMENLLATDPIRDFHWFGYWIEDSQRLKALQNGYDNKEIFDNNFTLKMKLFQIVYSIPALAYYQIAMNYHQILTAKNT
jgi:aminoglycoside phosphotransferase (APT) family kinase protein